MTAFYNEIDPYAAQWLRNLIAAGHIAPGVVDERPIQEIEAYELVEFTQCHFFAGIGIWSHALRRAGWSDDRPIWTGSCPCQPFSNAGQKKGFKDDRHLWPHWQKLIDECKPSVVIGEQVASALDWVDLVQADLEKSGYAFGANDLCAAGFGGAHIRQRIYFVGVDDLPSARRFRSVEQSKSEAWDEARLRLLGAGCSDGGLADDRCTIIQSREQFGNDKFAQGEVEAEAWEFEWRRTRDSDGSTVSGMVNDDGERSSQGRRDNSTTRHRASVTPTCGFERLADASNADGRRGECGTEAGIGPDDERRRGFAGSGIDGRPDAPLLGREAVDWLYCRDGKWRPVGPGTFPLVNETPARVGRLRAYGNGLDAETATEFCGAVREICDEAGI